MRILYLGLPLGALCLLKARHQLVGAFIGHTDAPGMRRLRRALGPRSVPILGRPDLGDNVVVQVAESLAPDAVLSWFWPRLIPASVLAIPKRGAFGVHPSLLPRWRGPDPYFWAIASGDRETGVTLHQLADEYDTGAIVGQTRVPIAPTDTGWSLARRLDRPSLALLIECADRLRGGDSLDGSVQDDALVTRAPRPSDDVLAIDWNASTEQILRLVRAAAPWPGASMRLGELEIDVLSARPMGVPRSLRVGEAIVQGEGVVVCTADGGVLLECVRDEQGLLHHGVLVSRLTVF